MPRFPSLHSIGRSISSFITRPATELDPAAAYELWAATYDDAADNALLFVESPIILAALKQIDVSGKTVLDAGCGTGRHFHAIQQGSPKLLAGIDLSSAMLHHAQHKIPTGGTTFLQVAGIERLPFRDDTFDVVLSTLVLAHVHDLRAAVSELSRVMRRGGTLLVSCFHPFGKLLSWQRSFQANGSSGTKSWFTAKYHLHLHSAYFNALTAAKLDIHQIHEPVIDETVRPFYERAGRVDMYRQFEGYPLLLFFLARKQ